MTKSGQYLSRNHIKHMLTQFSSDELVNHLHLLERQRVDLQVRNKSLQEAEVKYSVLLEHYRLLYQYAPVGYLTIDYNGLVMKANQTLANMLGYALPDLLRESLQSLMPSVEGKFFLKQLGQLRKAGKGKYETRLITQDRGLIDVSFEGYDFDMGEVIQLNVVNISELKALQIQYKMYLVAMQESESSIALLDANGMIISVNKSLCHKSFRQQKELQGLHISKVFSLEHAVNFFSEVQKHLLSNRRWLGQVLYQHKQGGARQYECMVYATRHDAARQTNYILMFDVAS